MGDGRIRLVLLFGGRSAEHEVSCTSAVSVLRVLDQSKYDVVPVGITHEGRWLLAEETQKLLATGGQRALPASLEVAGPEVEPLVTIEEPSAAGAGDVVVFPLLHGPFGEDGTVQGLCELAGVPYVGTGVLGSAVAMDKTTAKRLFAQAGIPQANYLAFPEWQRPDDLAKRVEADFGWPVFVKPANLGSSVGVSKATDGQSLQAAVDEALTYDEWVVVEEAVTGREIECGVLGDTDPQASLPGEVVPSHDFYDYDDKYVDGAADLVVPADLSADVTAEIQRMALEAFVVVRAEGLARVDFFYEEAGRGLLLNEVNTMPGFTPISMYPRMWEASGVSYAQLVDRLVGLALDRHRRRSKVGRGRELDVARGAPPDTSASG